MRKSVSTLGVVLVAAFLFSDIPGWQTIDTTQFHDKHEREQVDKIVTDLDLLRKRASDYPMYLFDKGNLSINVTNPQSTVHLLDTTTHPLPGVPRWATLTVYTINNINGSVFSGFQVTASVIHGIPTTIGLACPGGALSGVTLRLNLADNDLSATATEGTGCGVPLRVTGVVFTTIQ